MVFYDNYYEGASRLPKTQRKSFLVAILDYYYKREEPNLPSSADALFQALRPLLDKSISCSEKGAKSGLVRAAKARTNGEHSKRKNNSPSSEGEQKRLLPSRPPSPVSDLVSVSGVGDTPSLQETVAVATGVMGVSEEFARWWHGEMTARDWTNTDGTTIGRRNWRPVLKAWWNNRRDGEMREINEAARASKERERVYSPADWGLCRERCAKCGEHGCTAGAKVPPQFWAPPQQPEQCPRFRSI